MLKVDAIMVGRTHKCELRSFFLAHSVLNVGKLAPSWLNGAFTTCKEHA